MGVKIFSEERKILTSGTVEAFGEKSDITFKFTKDEENPFDFEIRFLFESDDTGIQSIKRKIEDSMMELKCMNFWDSGTGMTTPLQLITSKDYSLYIRFWSYLQGGMDGREKTRKLEYAFFLEKQVIKNG